MNIIFDLGRVVLEWNPKALVERTFDDAGERERVMAGVFEHEDWIQLDRGAISQAAAIERFAERTAVGVDRIRVLMERVPETLLPVQEVLCLIQDLRKQDHRIFCLSNIHKFSYEYLVAQHSFWNLFDGAVISAYVNMIKPEPGIYRHLLEKYGLEPADTIFIDDNQTNLDAAAELGIGTVRFEDVGKCRELLADKWGITAAASLETLRALGGDNADRQ